MLLYSIVILTRQSLIIITFRQGQIPPETPIFAKLKKSGLTIPFQDGIIAYLAIKNDCQLWTFDNHFKLIKTVVPVLKLFG